MPSNAHSTGANTTPLGRVNPALGSGRRATTSSLLNPNYLVADEDATHGGYETKSPPSYSAPSATQTWKRGIEDSNDSDSNSLTSDRKKKKRSRWGVDEKEKTFIPGMPTVLPANLTKDQEEAYLSNEQSFLPLFTKSIVCH